LYNLHRWILDGYIKNGAGFSVFFGKTETFSISPDYFNPAWGKECRLKTKIVENGKKYQKNHKNEKGNL
jgi:hypothetical protein